MMQPSIFVNMEDARQIIAKHFGVDPKDVIKQQYSFTVLGGKMPEEKETVSEENRKDN